MCQLTSFNMGWYHNCNIGSRTTPLCHEHYSSSHLSQFRYKVLQKETIRILKSSQSKL